jgi:hypothetical protein
LTSANGNTGIRRTSTIAAKPRAPRNAFSRSIRPPASCSTAALDSIRPAVKLASAPSIAPAQTTAAPATGPYSTPAAAASTEAGSSVTVAAA